VNWSSSPITYLTVGTRSVSVAGFTIMDGWFPAGLQMPAHYHAGPTLAVILQGSFAERLSLRDHECRPGDLVVKPPGETHRDTFLSRGRAIAIEVVGERLAQLGPYIPRDALYTRNEEAQELAWRMARALRDPVGLASSLALEGLALELIATALRRDQTAGRVGPSWLRRFVEMLHDAPCDLPTIAAMARSAHMHPVYLARVFKTYYHCSLGVYARRLRLQWAAHQLVSTHEAIASIAQHAGFYDQSHFSRAFAAAMGLTPCRYRHLFARQALREPAVRSCPSRP
jgi:AraC family transcriptional regulator